MALESYEDDLMRCNRCSYCKHLPHDAMEDARFLGICPSIGKYNLHSRSAGGRLITALSLLRGRIEWTEAVREIVYQCQMCGGCDVSCKVERDLEPYEILQELRFRCAEKGLVPPRHTACVESVKGLDNSLGQPRRERGAWAEGLGAKSLDREKAEVLFHAGCLYSFDPALRETARNALSILLDAGLDVGILGRAEICCGGRSYEMGFKGALDGLARRSLRLWRDAGVKTVVTPCAGCYQAFKVLYDKEGAEAGVEVLHITQLISRLLREGGIKPTKEVPLRATYHDPCHLGRLAEPWVHWRGETKKVFGQMVVHEPPRQKRFGVGGVFDEPREILSAIPGLKLSEMPRRREYAWCCGSGSGVREAYPELARSTGRERIEEARSTGAEVLVTACPRCRTNLEDSGADGGGPMKVYDVVDLLRQAL